MISIHQFAATRKLWHPEITATSAGVSLAPMTLLLIDREFAIPAIDAPCTEPGSYRLVLVIPNTGTASIALLSGYNAPADDATMIDLAWWTLGEGETCEDVEIKINVCEQVSDETYPEPTRFNVSATLATFEPSIAERIAAIDAATDARIAEGFVFRGLRFSASLEAQARSLGVFAARDLLAYPLRWNSIDDGASIDLETANDVAAFHLAGMAHVRSCVDAGTLAKDAARGGQE